MIYVNLYDLLSILIKTCLSYFTDCNIINSEPWCWWPGDLRSQGIDLTQRYYVVCSARNGFNGIFRCVERITMMYRSGKVTLAWQSSPTAYIVQCDSFISVQLTKYINCKANQFNPVVILAHPHVWSLLTWGCVGGVSRFSSSDWLMGGSLRSIWPSLRRDVTKKGKNVYLQTEVPR